jgi:hypothetical protein
VVVFKKEHSIFPDRMHKKTAWADAALKKKGIAGRYLPIYMSS